MGYTRAKIIFQKKNKNKLLDKIEWSADMLEFGYYMIDYFDSTSNF